MKRPDRMLKTGLSFAMATLFGISKPLVVGWALTTRCNRKCLYCSLWKKETADLSTAQVLGIIDELAGMGTAIISFTGGEPLTREEIGSIVDYCHERGIKTKINSNGALVKKRLPELKNLDTLALSLDGPKAIHNAIRGEGSYDEVMEAARSASEAGIKVNFVTVLTKDNMDVIDFVLSKAEEFRGTAVFQPASPFILGGEDPNPMAPDPEGFRRAVKGLIDKKKKPGNRIGSSMTTLRHLYGWPDKKKMKCASGIAACRIEPNGDMTYCSRQVRDMKGLNCVRDGVKKAFGGLKPVTCLDCWCASRVELNYLTGCDPAAICGQLRQHTG